MRSTGSGPLGALLMLAPLIAVPILAVVGIPQFAPGNLLDPNGANSRTSARERRVPDESGVGDDARPDDADDLFEPIEKSQIGKGRFRDPLSSGKSKTSGRWQNSVGADFDDEAPAFDQDENSLSADDERGTSETDADLFEQDAEPDEKPLKRPGNSRPRPEQFVDASQREGFSDEGESFGSGQDRRPNRPRPGSSSFETDLPPDEDANPLEQSPPPAQSRPHIRKPRPSRDPNDAPPFVESLTDGTEAPGDDVDTDADVVPAPKQTSPRRPQPVVPPAPPAETAPSDVEEQGAVDAPSQTPAVDELTWQSATKRLRSLGVGKSKQHFTYVEDRNLFLFTCTATHLDDSTKSKSFQAEAEEPLLAVRQVLERLQAWQDSDIKVRSNPRTSQRAGL